MANSSTVAALDDILAGQYNNLRLDVLDATSGHDHDGTEGKKVNANDLSGTTLASGVTASSLTSVGTLAALTVSGNVGIGTAGPQRLVDIVGSTSQTLQHLLRLQAGGTAFAGAGPSIVFETGSDANRVGKGAIAYLDDGSGWNRGSLYFMNRSSGDVVTADATDVHMVITNNGNVGIGTTAPSTLLHVGLAGTTQGTLGLAGATSGLITVTGAAAAGTWTWTLPPDDGDAGEQLQTNGSGTCTWEAAASQREYKHVRGRLDSGEALRRILSVPIYEFTYKSVMDDGSRPRGTGDYETIYAGAMADEAPWLMHHDGGIFSPVSAFGHAATAIQALYERIAALEARLN